ncbi:DEAD/DEAH box helicase [Lutibacter sp. A80]|uniref:DEAD/DEAH box helicase n=1 Tax=Lutibacter sp. A80 TaxID=2918453 RepID=UPI001F05C09E|nr:DEAD/DEAH box helicase [Lutibacter sp. A80]UMB61210.1 DEAD/DEAH box helicase [Lutibacter sp. A80]
MKLLLNIPFTGSIFALIYYKPNKMPFKKLHPEIQEKLTDLKIETPTSFQRKSIPVIKSGSNVYCTAAKGSGKTTTLILTTLQKLKYKAVGTLPRAIVVVETKEKALELYEAFLAYTRHSSLRVYVGHEHIYLDLQKSEIFEGVDILISTPDTMNKLFLSNGVGTSQLLIFNIDDAEFLAKNSAYNALMSITQSIHKCQYVLYSEKKSAVLKRFESYFMEYAKTIAV